jgi:hypothetical protein
MPNAPEILLIDDGELDAVAGMLDRLHLTYTRMRGGRVEGELAPPSVLLIATPRRASSVRRGSPAGTPAGRPMRIIAADEDSKAMRRMLRRMGFNLLVRRGAHADVWRLLVERAMFDGDDRREDERMPVGATVRVSEAKTGGDGVGGDLERAALVDISNRGCRLRTSEWLAPGARLSLEIALPEPEADTLRVSGRLVRSSLDTEAGPDSCYSAGMLFDEDMPHVERERLGRLLNDLSIGPGSLAAPDAATLPECESPVIPGLTLDAETDPALPAGVEVGLRRTRDLANRRQMPRGSFAGRVLARLEDASSAKQHVLMGRDLSAGGMRVDPCEGIEIGDQVELAIYGPGEPHPFLVRAQVERSDGDHGTGLRFTDVSSDMEKELEKLVACLPDIESLEGGERGGLGAVISEILSRTPAE